jgi:hypothetical protein
MSSRFKITSSCVLVALACFVAILGCKSNSTRNLAEVEGTITLDGEPLFGAEVIFRPTEGRPSLGKTDSNGKYRLRYSTEKMGALIGTHTVTISSWEDESGDEDSTSPKEKVPAEYNTHTTLSAEVVSDQKEPINFDLATRR